MFFELISHGPSGIRSFDYKIGDLILFKFTDCFVSYLVVNDHEQKLFVLYIKPLETECFNIGKVINFGEIIIRGKTIYSTYKSMDELFLAFPELKTLHRSE